MRDPDAELEVPEWEDEVPVDEWDVVPVVWAAPAAAVVPVLCDEVEVPV